MNIFIHQNSRRVVHSGGEVKESQKGLRRPLCRVYRLLSGPIMPLWWNGWAVYRLGCHGVGVWRDRGIEKRKRCLKSHKIFWYSVENLWVSSRNTKIKLYITLDFSRWSDHFFECYFVSKTCSEKPNKQTKNKTKNSPKKPQAIPFYVGYTKMSFPKNLILSPRAHNKLVPFYLSIIIFYYFPVWLSNPNMLVSWGFFYKYHFLFWDTHFWFFGNSSFK